MAVVDNIFTSIVLQSLRVKFCILEAHVFTVKDELLLLVL